ncbi:MAG: DUF6377 domain-containing protein [Alloprevotella sp.]|nr:DUF6377 domain-containing protein [Alloprevotella sp.]
MIEESETIVAEKNKKIATLKQMAAKENNTALLLGIYHELSEEYYVFKFDSAKVYVEKGLALAKKVQNSRYIVTNTIMKAKLLSIGGLYSEAINTLNTIEQDSLGEQNMIFDYNIAYSTIYSYWADYCNDDTYSPIYRERSNAYLKNAIANIDKNNAAYDYYMGEYYVYIDKDDDKALEHYFRALEKNGMTSRVYAMASFAIANNYSAHENMEKYEEYLIKASICDILCCTKENLALQDLAMHLFKQDNENIERARVYINTAMDDAKSYNNRLRILEISQKLPIIVSTYHKRLTTQNSTLMYAVWGISLLVVTMIVLLYFFVRQNKLLSKRRHELHVSNNMLTETNERLNRANEQLLDTNRKREGLAKLYIDLCAKYIDKMAKFQVMVQRKIKANQINELMSYMSSSRLNYEDADTFMKRFDEAFLNLYPSFVTEFNALLKEDEQVITKNPHSLTTELRIFALIRLGVKESSEIAALLYYTPRTIYNYRSAFKNKALDRESFEERVCMLCTIINN